VYTQRKGLRSSALHVEPSVARTAVDSVVQLAVSALVAQQFVALLYPVARSGYLSFLYRSFLVSSLLILLLLVKHCIKVSDRHLHRLSNSRFVFCLLCSLCSFLLGLSLRI